MVCSCLKATTSTSSDASVLEESRFTASDPRRSRLSSSSSAQRMYSHEGSSKDQRYKSECKRRADYKNANSWSCSHSIIDWLQSCRELDWDECAMLDCAWRKEDHVDHSSGLLEPPKCRNAFVMYAITG